MSADDVRPLQRPRKATGALSPSQNGSALVLGSTSEIKGSSVVVALVPETAEDVRAGDFVGIPGNDCLLVGQVDSVGFTPHPMATLKIIASLNHINGALTPGRREIPRLGAQVVRPSKEVIRAILESRSSIRQEGAAQVRITLATARGYPDLQIAIPPEKLFGRHCAVVGSSGGGKSCSVARIIEQCAKFRSKVILLDPTGEYETLQGPTFQVHVGHPTRLHVKSSAATLPFFELTEADLVAIFEPDSMIQVAKLRAAIRTLKLLHLDPRLGTDGVFPKSHREKLSFERAYSDYKLEIEAPQNVFNLSRLPLQIELECVEPNRSHTETGFWGGANTLEIGACASFINRVSEVLLRDELEAIIAPRPGPSVFETIDSFLQDPNFSVLRISLEFLPTIYNTREIICNAIARRLLALGRAGALSKHPTLLVLDEAHQVLKKGQSNFTREYPLDAFNIIAKEGRKYGLSLCVATQRPGDIPEDVISQMGTFIVHRLASDADRGAIERASGAVGQTLLEDLPTLAPGEAFILGLDYGIPLQVTMSMPQYRPRSNGPDYQQLWQPRTVPLSS